MMRAADIRSTSNANNGRRVRVVPEHGGVAECRDSSTELEAPAESFSATSNETGAAVAVQNEEPITRAAGPVTENVDVDFDPPDAFFRIRITRPVGRSSFGNAAGRWIAGRELPACGGELMGPTTGFRIAGRPGARVGTRPHLERHLKRRDSDDRRPGWAGHFRRFGDDPNDSRIVSVDDLIAQDEGVQNTGGSDNNTDDNNTDDGNTHYGNTDGEYPRLIVDDDQDDPSLIDPMIGIDEAPLVDSVVSGREGGVNAAPEPSAVFIWSLLVLCGLAVRWLRK